MAENKTFYGGYRGADFILANSKDSAENGQYYIDGNSIYRKDYSNNGDNTELFSFPVYDKIDTNISDGKLKITLENTSNTSVPSLTSDVTLPTPALNLEKANGKFNIKVSYGDISTATLEDIVYVEGNAVKVGTATLFTIE